jgi:hypothetical protein
MTLRPEIDRMLPVLMVAVALIGRAGIAEMMPDLSIDP